MSDKPINGDRLTSNSDEFPQMSRSELYDMMYQMKLLADDNPQQARQILAENPRLARFVFQAQILLGMMGTPRETPNTQASASQHNQQPSAQTTPQMSGTSGSQNQIPITKQMENSMQSTSATSQMPPSLIPTMPSHPISSASQPLARPHMSTVSNQLQQPGQTPILPHMPLQPPLPPHPRLPPMPTFQNQHPSQLGTNMGFQQSGGQLHHSQPVFHSGTQPNASIGPSFTQAQPPLPSQLPSQSFNQIGGPHLRTEFNNPAGNSMQVDRGSTTTWMPPRHENTMGAQIPGPPPLVSGFGPSNPPPRPPMLNPEMEKALLQQVMSLTPEQINCLPPEQRHQILQLQQMLRQ